MGLATRRVTWPILGLHFILFLLSSSSLPPLSFLAMIHACGLLGCEGRSRGLHSRLLREKVVRLPDSYLIGGLARALTERNRKA